jgi:hypothetical protein
MVRAACRPNCIATSATPGKLLTLIRSPTTNTSGCAGSVQSGSTATRPDRSTAAPLFAARRAPTGEALTPAAQTLVRSSILRGDPSGPTTFRPYSSTPVTLVASCVSTPRWHRSRWALRDQRLRHRSAPPRRLRWSATHSVGPRLAPVRPTRTRRRSALAPRAHHRSSSARVRTRRIRRGRSKTIRPRWQRSRCRSRREPSFRPFRASPRAFGGRYPSRRRAAPAYRVATEDVPDRRGDVARSQDAGRHLVEQWLEQMMVSAVDHGHVHWGAPEGFGGSQAARSQTQLSRSGVFRSMSSW